MSTVGSKSKSLKVLALLKCRKKISLKAEAAISNAMEDLPCLSNNNNSCSKI